MPNFVNGFYPGELQPDTIVGGNIHIYENAWPNPERTIELIEKECADSQSGIYWEQATTIGAGRAQNMRTNKMLGISQFAYDADNKLCQNIHNQFNMLLLASTLPYAQKNGIEDDLIHEGYSLLKYSGGEEYKQHYDGSTTTKRAISALVYLNDDFEGGELEFPAFNLKIQPRAGMHILFPSNFAYRHIAYPVTSGTKYGLVTWIRDQH
jgi:predicted 2-oxoglutarate/Fe(II)-dependent dioxygenase YbiX